MVDKTKSKNLWIATLVILVVVAVLFICSFLAGKNETAGILRLVAFVLILAILIFRLFGSSVGYKPTREEIEEKTFHRNKTSL